MDYRKVSLSRWENLALLPLSLAAGLLISWLFYDSFYGIYLFPAAWFFLAYFRKQQKRQQQQIRLAEEFLDTLRILGGSLQAGYSMENAMKEAQKELKMLRGTDSLMFGELKTMNRLLSMNVPLEQVLEEFAGRSGNEDILEFSEVFRFAKRGGGNLGAIITATTTRMTDRFETEKEIQVVIASRRMEQKVMNLVPLGIIAYLKLGSGEYLAPLYGNLFGILFMTLCLGAYGAALYISGKVMDIHV